MSMVIGETGGPRYERWGWFFLWRTSKWLWKVQKNICVNFHWHLSIPRWPPAALQTFVRPNVAPELPNVCPDFFLKKKTNQNGLQHIEYDTCNLTYSELHISLSIQNHFSSSVILYLRNRTAMLITSRIEHLADCIWVPRPSSLAENLEEGGEPSAEELKGRENRNSARN